MNLIRILAVFFSCTVGTYSFASGQQPCSSFVSKDLRSFSLDSAYKAADLVVIGQVSRGEKQILKISAKIKGDEKAEEIELASPHCQGTACSGGFSVAPNVDLLFLLKRQASGVYDSVTGNGNYSCPVVHEVEKGAVKFRDKKVPVESLKKYFESKPDPVPLF